MKWIGRTLVVLVLLALIVFAVYLVYNFVLPNLGGILFFIYLIFGLVFAVIGAGVFVRDAAKSKGLKDTILSSIGKAASKPTLLATSRNIATALVTMVDDVITWPAAMATGITTRSPEDPLTPQRFVLWQSIRLTEHFSAVFALSVLLIGYILGLVGVTGNGYGRAFIALMLLSVVLRHIRHSVETEGLPVRLRRKSGSSYLVFLLIILADFSSLVFAFALFIKRRHAIKHH
jgi:hypothetical protein